MMSPLEKTACPCLEELDAFVESGSTDAVILDHLKSCDACSRQLDLIRSNADFLEEIASGDSAPILINQRDISIPGYEIEREIHRGGQGVVYEAVQKATSRRVALKLLLQGALATTRQRKRFEREVEVAATLKHPNIVTVYESGETTDGRHYLAMELIDGSPLDDFLLHSSNDKEEPISLNDILRLFADIALAVGYAHQRGVIHRDLKPANIIIDSKGDPHIVDFGLAKALASDEKNMLTVTQSGEFMGTLAYASPEHVSGEPDAIDVRSDVYSLGVILYEMLTSRLPYTVTGSLDSIVRAITESQPEPFDRFSPSSSESGGNSTAKSYSLNDEVQTIARKALAKEPDRRYQSAGHLARDIEHYLAGEPIDAKRDSTLYILRKSVKRHKWPVAAALTFVVLVTAFAIVMTVQSGIVTAERNTARSEGQKAEQFAGFLTSIFDSVNEAVEAGRDVRAFRSLLDEAVPRIDMELSDEPLVEARVRNTLGSTYFRLGAYEDAELHLRRALDLRRSNLKAGHPEIANTLSGLAGVLNSLDRFEESEKLSRQAVEMLIEAVGPTNERTLDARRNLALVLIARGNIDEAETILREQLKIYETGEYDPVDEAKTLETYTSVQELRAETAEDFADVEARNREVLARYRKIHGENHPSVVRVTQRLAALLGRLNRHDEAEKLLKNAIEILREMYEDPHPSLSEALTGLAASYFNQGRYAEAEPLMLESLALDKQIYSDVHSAIVIDMSGLAMIYDLLGRTDEARELFRQVVELDEQIYGGQDHEMVADSHHNFGTFLYRSGLYEEAQEEFEIALAIKMRIFGENHPLTALTHHNLAVLFNLTDRAEDALPHLQEAMRIRLAAFGEGHPMVDNTMVALGACLTRLDRYEEAEPLVVDSYRAIQARRGDKDSWTLDALQAVINLYDAWDKTERADEYRMKMPGNESSDDDN